MRGEHRPGQRDDRGCAGIIPACAGSTGWYQAPLTSTAGSSPHARGAPNAEALRPVAVWDHPRMRGEHNSTPTCVRDPLRIIPACAGSTEGRRRRRLRDRGSSPHARGAPVGAVGVDEVERDHPRMRGEHNLKLDIRVVDVGIIPACAGSTKHDGSLNYGAEGSSPHARGAQ